MKINHGHLSLIAFATFYFQLLTHNIQAQASFLPATTFTVGGNPGSAITADFNGDGKADLAIMNPISGNGVVSVLLGNGVGGFGAASNFPVGINPSSITSGDFNGDSAVDLAVTSYNDNNVSVLLGNGLGSFGSANNFTTGISPTSIISADFNADGKTDLVVAALYNNIVSVLQGDGLGGFGTNTDFTVNYHPISLTSADFNTDGKIDIAVGYQSSSISVLLGDGAGNLGSVSDFAIVGSDVKITSGDFNGDGKADLATANQTSNKISVLLGNGAGSFGTAANFSAGTAPFSIITADFNSDGKADLAVSNIYGNNVSVFLGDGAGNMGVATNFAVGTAPRSAINADLNGDGKADLVVSNSNDGDVSVLLNNFLPAAPPICLVTVDSTLTHNLLVWEKTNLNLSTIDSFIVYREITTNNYQRIASVSKDSLSIFNDLGANPATTGYRYKLKIKNAQGVVSLFSNYHNTIYLTNTGANFNWTPYQIENNTTPVSTYNVYRDNISDGNFILIGNTTGNQFGFTDVQYSSFPNSQYYVEAVMAGGICQPTRSGFATSRSNVKHIGMSGVQQLNNNSIIKIYPTPTINVLNITGIKEKTTIQMYDVVGKLVIEKEVGNNTTINTNLLPEGVYTLLTESKAGRTFNKVVINR